MPVDTSSYQQPEGKSVLDVAQQFGQMKQQQLNIDKSKFDQANQALTYVTRAMAALGPNATKEQYKQAGAQAVQMGLVPPAMLNVWNEKIDAAPTPKAAFDEFMTAAAQHQEVINYHLGSPVSQDNQQGTVIGRIPVRTGEFDPKTIIPRQIPPTQPVVDPQTGQPQLYGTGQQQGPVALPVGPRAGVQGPSANFGGNVQSAVVEPLSLPATPPVGRGPTTAPSPMFEEGKKAYAADQDLATQKLTAIKPALQALPLLKGIMAGPGTDAFTKAVAGLKAFGIIPIEANDPTAIRQEVSKKLAQYLSNNPRGARSDAAQYLAEMGSPNPGVQIAPALEKLVIDSVALDRIEAMRANAYQSRDFSKYPEFRSKFPATFDERAVTLDMLEPKKRQTLLDEMKKKQNTTEGKKFWQSLAEVKRQGIFDTPGAQ